MRKELNSLLRNNDTCSWQKLSELCKTNGSRNINIFRRKDGSISTDSDEGQEIFTNFCKTIFNNENDKIPPPIETDEEIKSEDIKRIRFTEKMLRKR